MKKVLDTRSLKIKELKSIIRAYDDIRAESSSVSCSKDEDKQRLQNFSSTSRSTNNGHRSYQFLNIPGHWPRFRGPNGIANTQQFFDAFKRQVVPALNPETLLHDGARYLGLLIELDEDVDAFNKVIKDDAVDQYDVDTLERLFLQACITPEEREQSLRDMATIGRLPHESWKVFAIRVQRKVHQFQVKGDTTYLVSHLLSSLPSALRNLIRSGNGMKDPTTVSEFCDILSKCLGPDNLIAETTSDTASKSFSSGNRTTAKANRLTRCAICGRKHNTEDHVNCGFCGKAGHAAEECHRNPASDAPDTGASKSFIDRSIVQHTQLRINPAQGKIRLGDKNQFGDRTGETEPVEIRCNEHSIFTALEVFDLEFAFIIGMDIFHELGFSIGGISDGREDAHCLPPPIPDEKPSILPIETPAEELNPKFLAERKAFMHYIESTLQSNAEVPRNSYCPVPEMLVRLPVPKGTTVFRKPRPFAEQQMHIFDEQVAKWLADEVITLAPA
ncbi:hypothetical protein BGX28_000535, partial [Mortierella sp. GBA30]